MQDDEQDQVDGWQRQLRKGALELAVLGLLRDKPRYGLELVECLKPLGVASGTIYPLLARIRREAKVESEWVDDDVGHPRKYYTLAPEGRRAFDAQLQAWRTFSDALAVILGEERDVAESARR
jgi:PadR family transcriptional regulator, regulatory protein PadR